MLDRRDDLIKDVLVDSDLAKLIVPNKFKHTSKQGRARRQKLLMGAKKLGETRDIQRITLADVCEEAGIPRASAYHFFPNVESIFLALRLLNFMEVYNALDGVDISKYEGWQDFITDVLRKSVKVFNKDVTKNKLMYGSNTPDFDGNGYDERLDKKMVELLMNKLDEKFSIAKCPNIGQLFLITYNIAHSIFALSFRQHKKITDEMLEESIKACICYLSCHLPAKLPLK